MEIVFFLFGLPVLIILIDFLALLFSGGPVVNKVLFRLAELGGMIILPWMYIGMNMGVDNNCCGDSPAFARDHNVSILLLVVICVSAYYYCSVRTRIAPPVIEVLLNMLIVAGVVLNIFIAVHATDSFLFWLGSMPIVMMGIMVLVKNHRLFITHVTDLYSKETGIRKLAWRILNLPPFAKFPVILILCLPMLIVIICILLLFGQKPDSVIRAFTDTYKHGFSQLDHECDNIVCGGHFLCSVAAKGHPVIVKPKRRGIRNNGNIICNRQLLVSNAFEDFIQERAPRLHTWIRGNYNRVGKLVHSYYAVFDNRLVSDMVYLLMKPLEWVFLLFLYTFDREPEDRIAKQYISPDHRKWVDVLLVLKKTH